MLSLRCLQCVIALLALIPISAGTAGMIFGAQAFTRTHLVITELLALDSHTRYLSGLLLGIGLAFWSTIPDIAHKTEVFRILTSIVFIGGLARLGGVLSQGIPGWAMLVGLAMELIVTPLLCVWQSTLSK